MVVEPTLGFMGTMRGGGQPSPRSTAPQRTEATGDDDLLDDARTSSLQEPHDASRNY